MRLAIGVLYGRFKYSERGGGGGEQCNDVGRGLTL